MTSGGESERTSMFGQLPDEELAHWLTRSERSEMYPNLRPKDAATLILIDRTGGAPKVLLGRRHHSHAFMPGKFVFPGGRVERADGAAAVATPLHPVMEDQLMRQMPRPSAAKARALAMAAIREVCEETGLLLGQRGSEPSTAVSGPWQAFAAAGIKPDLARLRFVNRAVTPPRRPRRFDTRFFAVDASAITLRVDNVVGPDSELTELAWVSLSETPQLDMPTITKVALLELQARIAAGFGHGLPVPFYRMVRGRFQREWL